MLGALPAEPELPELWSACCGGGGGGGDDAQRMTAAESSVGDSGRVAGLLCLRDSLRKAKLPILLLGGFWVPLCASWLPLDASWEIPGCLAKQLGARLCF